MDNAAPNVTWYVFNMSDMCSSKQPEYVMLKTLDTPCVKYVPENEKLRVALKALIAGVHHEICEGRVSHECEKCAMSHSKGGCIMTDVMDFFDDDEVIDLLAPANQQGVSNA